MVVVFNGQAPGGFNPSEGELKVRTKRRAENGLGVGSPGGAEKTENGLKCISV